MDLKIERKDNKLDYSIYRKPTHTDVTIPFNSNHPMSHKLAAYNSMIHRAFSVPMNQVNFNKELNIIKQIATSNNYPLHIINKLIYKKEEKVALELIFPKQTKESKIYKSLTYYGNISNNISKIISRATSAKISFKTESNISLNLLNVKTKIPLFKKSGVYKLKCPDCDAVYIGQTLRNFEVRYSEHSRAYRLHQPDKSNFAKHLLDKGHSLTQHTHPEILHVCGKKQELDQKTFRRSVV